jgi:hypothetical protein
MHGEMESADAAVRASQRARPAARAAALVALVLAGCGIETRYVPRTPNTIALGMQRGEPVLYKDGVITKIDGVSAVARCSTSAAGDASAATSHYASYRSNAAIGGLFNALGALMPPLIGPGIYFTLRASDHQQRSYVHLVDAINKHNDDSGCVQQ